MDDRPRLRQRDVRRRFDRAAGSFDSADFVHTVTREGLVSRLEPLLLEAKTILDLGAATGSAGDALRRRYGRVQIVSLDLSREMLRQGAKKHRWFSRSTPVQADATKLPFASQSFDLVFANMLLPWVDRPEELFAEAARVLKEGGVLAFSTLGPDSLLELSRAWGEADSHTHVQRFADMHDIGDALVRSGIADPVLDVDRLTIQYADTSRLFEDLTQTGARNTLRDRSPALLGKRRFAKFRKNLGGQSSGEPISLELELVYGHGWGAGRRGRSSDFRIDASTIGRRRRQT